MSYSNRKGWFNLTDISLEERRLLLQDALRGGDPARIAEAYYLVGTEIDGEEAKECFHHGVVYGLKAKYPRVVGLAKLSLSQFAAGEDSIEKATELVQESIDNLHLSDDRYMEAGAVYQLGRYCVRAGDLPRAIDLYQASASIFSESDEPEGAAWPLIGLGAAAVDNSDGKGAINYYELALSLALQIPSKHAAQSALFDLISVYTELRDSESAWKYYQQVAKLMEQNAYLTDKGFLVQLLGRIQEIDGDTESAIRQYEAARSIFENEHKGGELMGLAPELANAYRQSGRLEEAAHLLESAREEFHKLNRPNDMIPILQELSKVQKEQGNWEKAFRTLEEMVELRSSFYSEDYKNKVASMQRILASEREKQVIELHKLHAEQAEQSLRMKERELANTASSLAAQTELLGEFRAELRKIVMRPDKVSAEDIIRQVRNKLKELPCEMIDFGKFEAQFATVHPEFRAKLETTYPDLTPQEIKICMLLHVNLQTTAIARLTCLSERTVENHRFNIRKKMGLGRDDNLLDVLRKLDGK